MSLMTVQAAASREIVATRPEDAARLMQSVETTGRDALADMRRMLGVLRNNDSVSVTVDGDQLMPQPSLDDLVGIIDHCNEAGTPTTLSIHGDQRPLSPGLELAAFRTVQEALTNVVKHAGEAATATVALRYGADVLHIEVKDTGRGAVTRLGSPEMGHGLIGMRERVEIYDGHVEAGPQPGGGYAVKASLPIGALPAPHPTEVAASERLA